MSKQKISKRELEQKVDFIMKFVKVPITVNGAPGVLGPDGQPTGQKLLVSLADLYKNIRNGSIKVNQSSNSALPPPTPSGQPGVGPDVGYESPEEPPSDFDFPPED